MNKNLQIILIVLFLTLLLGSIGSFIYGIVTVIQYQSAKKEGVPSKLLEEKKLEMIATLVIGIFGVLIFSFLMYLIFKDEKPIKRRYKNKSSVNVVNIILEVFCFLLLVTSIAIIPFGIYEMVRYHREQKKFIEGESNCFDNGKWARWRCGENPLIMGSISFSLGLFGLIVFGVLFRKFVFSDFKKLFV